MVLACALLACVDPSITTISVHLRSFLFTRNCACGNILLAADVHCCEDGAPPAFHQTGEIGAEGRHNGWPANAVLPTGC